MTLEEKKIQNLIQIIKGYCTKLAENLSSHAFGGSLLISINDLNKWIRIYFLEDNEMFSKENIELNSKIFNSKMSLFGNNYKNKKLNRYEKQEAFKERKSIIKKYGFVEVYRYLNPENNDNEVRDRFIKKIEICKDIIDILKNKNVKENIMKIDDFYNVINDYIYDLSLSPIEKLELVILIYGKTLNTPLSDDIFQKNYELLVEKYNNEKYLEIKEILQNMKVKDKLINEIDIHLNKIIN